MDIYRALIGEPPTEEEKLAAIAQALRARAKGGDVARMSGNRYIAPIGESMVNQADTQAQQLGVRGEQARYRKYQEGASQDLNNMRIRQQDFTEKEAPIEREHEILLELLRNRGRLQAAGMRTGSTRKLTPKNIMDLTSEGQNARRFMKIANDFQDSYAGAGPLGTGRPLQNALARYGVGTGGGKEAANWWGDFNQIYTLPERNTLFGATLTENEKEEWEKNAINERMTAQQIRKRLDWYKSKYREKIPVMSQMMIAEGYNPEVVSGTLFLDDEDEDIIDLE